MHESEKWKWSRSVVSDSLRPHGLQPTRLLRPWNFSRQEYWSGLPLPSVISGFWCYYYKKFMSQWRLKWWLAFFINNFFLIAPCSLGDLNSPIRDWTWPLAMEAPSPNHWTASSVQFSRSVVSVSVVPVSQLLESGGQSIGVSASASVLPMNIQDWFPLGWTGWISKLPGNSQ